MSIEYVLADPTGNITVLIRSSFRDKAERTRMIREAFELEPACEQAGFVVSDGQGRIRLEMMGYEFCGNAVLSSASLQALEDGITPGEQTVITVDSSGSDHPLEVRVTRLNDSFSGGKSRPVFRGSVIIPEPSMGSYRGHPVVNMSGISHIIIPESEFSPAQAESQIRGFAGELGVPALGILLYSDLAEHSVRIKPLVYVPESDTLVWEHGCATGSTAAGYCFFMSGQISGYVDVIQPGGIISIAEKESGLLLSGQVILHV